MNVLSYRNVWHTTNFEDLLFTCKSGGAFLFRSSVREMFTHSPKRSIRQATKESLFSFHCVQFLLRDMFGIGATSNSFLQKTGTFVWSLMMACYKDWSDLFKSHLRGDEVVFYIGGL